MTIIRTLVLLRHAKSAWPPETPDALRPLAERGRRDARAVGQWLRAHINTIDLVVCSPAVRATQTWELAATQLATAPSVRGDVRIYAASAMELLAVVQELPEQASRAALVGHNPALEDLLALLTGAQEPLKTSAIAVITTPVGWEAAGPDSCTLEMLATPRG